MDKKAFRLVKDKTALVIVDMQNDFVRMGAPLEVPDAKGTIQIIRKLILFARLNSIPVIYTKFVAGPQYTLIWEWSPQIEKDKCCWKGNVRLYGDSAGALECTDIIDEIYPQTEDYVIEKYGYSSFHNTNLSDILHSENRDTIIVAGTVTQICVADTVHGAFHNNIKAIVAEDAVSSFDPELHSAALKNIAMKYGRVEPVDCILSELNESICKVTKCK